MEQPHPQKYTCPMHPEIVRDKPGSCPICGMNLVPVKSEADNPALHYPNEEAKTKMDHTMNAHEVHKESQGFMKYTCPMHPQIVRDAPGKCPLCGMTLVPLLKSDGHDMHESHATGIADFKKRFYVV